jgi:hypothetical protein
MSRWLFFPALNPFIPDGEFTYCQLGNATISSMRPVDTVDGTFLYCAFDLNNSGFDRTP